MQQHEFSKTAFMVAGYRARATNSGLAICYDPWASRLAGDAGHELTERYDKVMPDTELWVSLRTRHIDDCIRTAIARGIRQVVVLGAGLDTRAARMAKDGVRFFEVDRPASQAAKKAGLDALADYPMDAATYVECDFERACFVDRLDEAGFDRDAPACFVLEGLIYYLGEADVRATLGKLSTCYDPESCIVFDYFDVDEPIETQDASDVRFDTDAAKDFLTQVGETVRFGVQDATPLLASCGFRYSRTISFAELALTHTGEYDPTMGFHEQWITVASPGQRLH